MIACIICGGVGEIMLVTAGFGWLIAWFKKRHNKKKCKCCQEHEIVEDVTKNSRPLTPEERKSVDEFFISQLKDGK